MNKIEYSLARVSIAFTLLIVMSIFCVSSYAEELQPGNRYKIVRPVYLSGVYRDLNNRQLNRQLAFGSLTAMRFSGPELAFQCIVPVGKLMSVIGTCAKRLPLPFFANRYFVRLDPDLSGGLDVIVELNRGMEGTLDGLNSGLF